MPCRAISQLMASVGDSVEKDCPPPVIPIDCGEMAPLGAAVVYIFANVALGPAPEGAPRAKAVLLAGMPVVPTEPFTISVWLCAGRLPVISVTDSAPDDWPKS